MVWPPSKSYAIGIDVAQGLSKECRSGSVRRTVKLLKACDAARNKVRNRKTAARRLRKDAARLLLHGQGLTGDAQAAPRATPAAVARLIEHLGFVQVDTISTVERATT